MSKRRGIVWQRVAVSTVVVTLLGGMLQTPWLPKAEAVSGSTPVRVGLMLKSNSFNTTTDTVTLQGRSGLQVGFYINGTFTPRFTASTSVKVSLDNYFIVVGEYDTLGAAQGVADRVDSLGYSFDIHVENRAGKKVYQVVNGFYEYRTQADTALSRLKSINGNAVIKGYNRLTTGKVANQGAAESKANELRVQGFDAYPTLRRDGSWEVWVGNEASAAERDALKGRVQSKTGASLAVADFNPADYLMMKQSYHGGKEIPHFVQNSTVEESAFVPVGQPAVIKVFEKAREYRGTILVQGYKERPNVINYLPLDSYLYGVLPQEMSSGWPLEALKAQAVAARTYAVRRIGTNKWGVADLVNDVWDQAYEGFTREAGDTNQAVDETKGQVLMKNGALIEALYSSNHGGYSGDVREIWGSQGIDYLTAVESPFDNYPAQREPLYYRVQLADGKIGWMRADSINKSGKNDAGLETGTVKTEGQPVRFTPDLYAKVMVNASAGTRVVILDEEREYNTFNWQKGPYSPTEMMNLINSNQISGYPTVGNPVYDLRVTKWAQGQHIREITADGKVISVTNPDYYRALFGNIWSTRATIEQTGTYTVLSGNGTKTEYPNAKLQGKQLNVISASSSTPTTAINGSNESFVVLGASSESRVVTKNQSYIIHGYGWGHALGMSQWGAHGMAKNGYTYDRILEHYYQGTNLTPKQ
jgi:stage II sporulation protein D